MTALLLAVIPIVLTALFAGQVAVTRTGRLRKDILANLDLLGRLPAEHPNRAALEAKNGELVGVLARRQQRRYGPFTPAGVSFGVCTGVAIVALLFAGFSALLAARVIPSRSRSARMASIQGSIAVQRSSTASWRHCSAVFRTC